MFADTNNIGILNLISVGLPDFRPHERVVVDLLLLRNIPKAIVVL